VGTGAGLAAVGLAWLAGVLVQLQQAQLWPVRAYVVLVALGFLACAVAAKPRPAVTVGPIIAAVARIVAVFALSLGAAGWHASIRLEDALDSALEGVDLELTGEVVGLPQAVPGGVRFRFDVDEARAGDRAVRVPRRVQLAWYRDRDADRQAAGPMDGIEAGQRWGLGVRLRQPHGSANPHGFDYELWLFEQAIRATGTVRDARGAVSAVRFADASPYGIDRWRQRVRESIARRVDDPRAAGVLAALAVGDQGAIEREDWQLFRDTGIAHLMSISGVHVTMFGWLAALAISAAWRRSPRLMLAMPSPVAARWGGLVAALGYAVFAGWGVPAQRTVWMLLVATLLASSGRRWPWPLVLLATAVVVSVIDPWALVQPGFWLSFTAVGLLLAAAPAQPRDAVVHPPAVAGVASRGRRALCDAVRTQAVATLGLTPLTLVFFHQVSLVGVLANLIAIPVVTLLVTPLALLGMAIPPLWLSSAGVVQALCRGLEWLASWPTAVWSVAAAPAWAQAAGMLAGVVAILPLPKRVRGLALPLALPLLWPVVPAPAHGEFEVLAADVGQGSAVLVRTRTRLLLYDAGPQYSSEADAGERVLVPLLRARGDARIDLLVLSHRDTDHVGGAAAVMRALPVGRLSSSLEPGHPLLSLSAAGRCEAGQRWAWDGVAFEVLHPPAAMYGQPVKPNALSCVVRVAGATAAALLAGDIEREQERAIVAAHGAALRSDLLLVPHHGSRTSSTAGLIDAVAPATAVVQAGYRNRFGHPRPDVVARYDERRVRVVTTPACGAFTWRSADGGASATCERDVRRRYWHHVASR
jgi:competence protein ComEC